MLRRLASIFSIPGNGGDKPAWRRLLLPFGLQRKLVLCFGIVLLCALAVSSWLSIKQSRALLSDILGEQAKQLSQTLAMAAQTAYEQHDLPELQRLGQDLLRSRGIVLVVFHDAQGRPISAACRDPDFSIQTWRRGGGFTQGPLDLMQVRQRDLPSLGDYLQVTAPVFDVVRAAAPAPARSPRLLGYLTVGVSYGPQYAQLQRASALAVAAGCLIFLLSIPLICLAVYRVLQPVRELAAAADRVAAGDYGVRVAGDRPDQIGMLARSFNKMAARIRQHQEELAAANEQLADANRELDQRVTRRTAELESANRRLSAEIAEKEDFLRAVSHDLNAPLRNISGMATMLLMKHRSTFDQEIIHRLERICFNVEMESSLLGELLELSRIKTRRQKMEDVEIARVVADVAAIFEEDLASKGIELLVEGELPVLRCERLRLRQVFQNLVDNAIKYMGAGPLRRIAISCAAAAEGPLFTVRDTGIGIDAEDLPKVFCIFRRGKNTAELNVAGKGVGLASVKSIIETYDGRIWVESRPGEGSAFRFTIDRRHLAGAPGRPVPPAEEENHGLRGAA